MYKQVSYDISGGTESEGQRGKRISDIGSDIGSDTGSDFFCFFSFSWKKLGGTQHCTGNGWYRYLRRDRYKKWTQEG